MIVRWFKSKRDSFEFGADAESKQLIHNKLMNSKKQPPTRVSQNIEYVVFAHEPGASVSGGDETVAVVRGWLDPATPKQMTATATTGKSGTSVAGPYGIAVANDYGVAICGEQDTSLVGIPKNIPAPTDKPVVLTAQSGAQGYSITYDGGNAVAGNGGVSITRLGGSASAGEAGVAIAVRGGRVSGASGCLLVCAYEKTGKVLFARGVVGDDGIDAGKWYVAGDDGHLKLAP